MMETTVAVESAGISAGHWMFYGGIAGAALCLATVIALLIIFTVKRRKILDGVMDR